jgi:hypothetical protein
MEKSYRNQRHFDTDLQRKSDESDNRTVNYIIVGIVTILLISLIL